MIFFQVKRSTLDDPRKATLTHYRISRDATPHPGSFAFGAVVVDEVGVPEVLDGLVVRGRDGRAEVFLADQEALGMATHLGADVLDAPVEGLVALLLGVANRRTLCNPRFKF